MTELQQFKARLLEGRIAFGIVIRSADVALAELAAYVGFDFGWIDMEHAPLSFMDVQHLIIALENLGCMPVVRVPSNDANAIGKALDLGAGVVVVPHVDTADDARRVVHGAKYFPLGRRGYASCSRSNRQGIEALDETTMARKNDENMVMVQIESQAGVENARDIAHVDGVDILFIGLGDLSQDLGVTGKFRHPQCVEAVETVSDAARQNHKIGAAAVMKVEDLEHFVSRGFRMITCAVDMLLMRDALRNRLDEFRARARE